MCKLPRHVIEQLNLNLKKSVKFIPKEYKKKKMDLATGKPIIFYFFYTIVDQ